MIRIEHDQFIGHYINALPIEVCNRFIEWYDLIESSGIATPAMKDDPQMTKDFREDTVIQVPGGLTNQMFPNDDKFEHFWPVIKHCYEDYKERYKITVPVKANNFKIHSVLPTQGYHAWHCEHSAYSPDRSMAWMVCLQPAEEGGETEFLFQSKRIKLDVGSLLIWPAGYTHKHRGNPPLKGRKIYITGWFHLSLEYNNSL